MMQQETPALSNPKDKWIPRYFVIFFVVVAILDGIFVYMAVSTQTGLVTEQAYEKGLAYNEILNEARAQPDIQQRAEFKDGMLRWSLVDEAGRPINDAQVSALIKRPVQEGYDFDIKLMQDGSGAYSARPDFPLPGQWIAKLSATWNNTQYRTSLMLIAE